MIKLIYGALSLSFALMLWLWWRDSGRSLAAKKAELEQAKLDERIATLETELIAACSEKELDFNKIIDKLDDIALSERRKAQFEKIIGEMFP